MANFLESPDLSGGKILAVLTAINELGGAPELESLA
jgi:hypothetical protein